MIVPCDLFFSEEETTEKGPGHFGCQSQTITQPQFSSGIRGVN